MSALDSKAPFSERLKQLGVEEELKLELQAKGFDTFGALAFAVSTTPQQITDSVLDTWLARVTSRELNPFQTSCVTRWLICVLQCLSRGVQLILLLQLVYLGSSAA